MNYETNYAWKTFYKVMVWIGTIGYAIAGIVVCADWADSYITRDISGIPFIVGIVLALFNLAVGMMIITAWENLQRIRECSEESLAMSSKSTQTEEKSYTADNVELPEL